MDPVFLPLLSGTVSVLRATGAIKTSADRIAAETNKQVRSLVREQLNYGLNALELAAHTDDPTRVEYYMSQAAEHMRRAAVHEGLPRHTRGFASAISAALAASGNDPGVARYWAAESLMHYEAAFHGVHRAATKAVDVQRNVPTLQLAAALVPLVGGGALHIRALAASQRVPSNSWVAELNSQADDAFRLAGELDIEREPYS
jgi:hypothetical protein